VVSAEGVVDGLLFNMLDLFEIFNGKPDGYSWNIAKNYKRLFNNYYMCQQAAVNPNGSSRYK
jgi:hypothetical protein